MGVFIKICGLCSREDVEGVTALRPDAVGFVFWAKSKRHVTARQAAEWSPQVPPTIWKVGVFVDASPEEMAETVRMVHLDVVQLHGPAAVDAATLGCVRVWSVVRPESPGAGHSAAGSRVDAYLLDSYSPESPGGTGQVGNWRTARDFVAHSPLPVILAGGLTPENVRDAIRGVNPWGVDVSTGVERSPGEKDLLKVKRFIDVCREF